MYCDWRNARLNDMNVPNEIVKADLNDLNNLTKSDLAFAMARFVREIKKIDNSDYPLTPSGKLSL